MIRTILMGALAALALCADAYADPAADAGRGLVQRNCSQCHAIGRTDESPLAGAPPFRDFSRSYPIEDLAEALAEGILTGHPAMPEFRFEPDEVRAIIKYLESIQANRQARAIGRDIPEP